MALPNKTDSLTFDGGRFRYFLSNSSFTSFIPLLITSVREIHSRFAHSSNKSSSSPLMRSCKLLSRLLVPLIGRPVLGDIFSPHFCHGSILTYTVAKVKSFPIKNRPTGRRNLTKFGMCSMINLPISRMGQKALLHKGGWPTTLSQIQNEGSGAYGKRILEVYLPFRGEPGHCHYDLAPHRPKSLLTARWHEQSADK